MGIPTTPEEQLRGSGAQVYDTIETACPATRRTEPRIAARLWAALGDARTVLNVGAGTGCYEPPDRAVTAVEPSAVMRAQRPVGAAQCVAAAERLPFEDRSFDAAMAVSTVHHWPDQGRAAGRTAGRPVAAGGPRFGAVGGAQPRPRPARHRRAGPAPARGLSTPAGEPVRRAVDVAVPVVPTDARVGPDPGGSVTRGG